MDNDLILALETATRGGSLALMRGESLIASSTGIADESHSVNLLSRIESLLNEAHITLRDVDLFATAAGPGSFTGLRIGLATMKAFAATFNRPCIGVPTLEAIAFAGGVSECTYALLPAGRGEVFAQVFSMAGTAGVSPAKQDPTSSLGARASRPPGARSASTTSEVESVPRSQRLTALDAGETPALPVAGPEHIPPDVLLARISETISIHWAGPGAHLYKDLIQHRATELGINFVDEHQASLEDKNPPSSVATPNGIRWTLAPNVEQLAQYVAILALKRANDVVGHRAEDLRAIYVRPSDAEMNK